MSNIPIFINPKDNPDNFEWFAFVVDGDVAWSEPIPIQNHGQIAALLSGVQAIHLTGDDRLLVKSGYRYVDGAFTSPVI